QRRRERRRRLLLPRLIRLLLAGLRRGLRCRLLLVRRRRGRAVPAHDPLLRLGRWRCILIGFAVRPDGRSGLLLLVLELFQRRLAAGWRLQRLLAGSRRLRGRSSVLLRLLLLLPLDVVLVELLGHALLQARHAVRENRLALARQFLLGIEEVEQIARIPAGAESARAAGEHARKHDQDHGCDQTLRASHGRSLAQVRLSSCLTLGNRGQQRLQGLGPRAQAPRRIAVGQNLIGPRPRRAGIVDAERRQRQQFARAVAEF